MYPSDRDEYVGDLNFAYRIVLSVMFAHFTALEELYLTLPGSWTGVSLFLQEVTKSTVKVTSNKMRIKDNCLN